MQSIPQDVQSGYREFYASEKVGMLIFDAVDSRLSEEDTAVKKALEELPHKQFMELEANINSACVEHIKAAFWLGWSAAKNPAAWIFDNGIPGRPTQENPDDIFMYKMQALGFGDIPAGDELNNKLFAVVCDLLSNADWLAFGLGWQSALDPSWLIFQAHTTDK